MHPDAESILSEIGRTGLARGWSDVVQAAAALAGPVEGGVLLAFADGVTRPPFQQWVASQAADRSPRSVSLADLRESPTLAHDADLLVLVFATEGLPSPADLQIAQQALSVLPRAMLATILIAGKTVSTDKDLAAARKMAWGLFVPEPKDTWKGQSFDGTRVFLWPGPDSGCAGALAADATALAAAVASAGSEPAVATERARLAVGHLLDLAQARVDADGLARRRRPVAAAAADPRAAALEARLTDRLHALLQEMAAAWRVALRAATHDLRDRTDARSSQAGGASAIAVTEAMARLREALSRAAVAAREAWGEYLADRLDAASWDPLAPDRASLLAALALDVAVPDAAFAWPDLANVSAPARAAPSLLSPGMILAVAGAAAVGALVGGAMIVVAGPHVVMAGALHAGQAAHAAHFGHGLHAAPHAVSLLDPAQLEVGAAMGAGAGGALGVVGAFALQALRGGEFGDGGKHRSMVGRGRGMDRQGGFALDGRRDTLEAELTARIRDRLSALGAAAEPPPPAQGEQKDADEALICAWRERLASLGAVR